MKIIDRYTSAVHSSNLKVSREADKTDQTVVEDTDALGAMGLADRDLCRGHDSQGNPMRKAELAVPLARLFAGDPNAVYGIVRTLAASAYSHSFELRLKISRAECVDLAKACLAWHQHGVCKPCGGHGYSLIPGVPSLSSHTCPACRGTGKIRLVEAFPMKTFALAEWMVDEMTREAGRAGPRAMARLSDSMNLS